MDTGAVRPLPVQVSTPPSRGPETTAPVAQTDLPEATTVTPTREAHRQTETARNQSREETRDKALEEVTAERKTKQKNFRDDVTDTFVYREVDEASGQVVRQFPEESIMRLRRALADTAQSTAAAPSVNRTL